MFRDKLKLIYLFDLSFDERFENKLSMNCE